jgi:hypothetical protein
MIAAVSPGCVHHNVVLLGRDMHACLSVRAEPVEALSLRFDLSFKKKGQPFDKLRANGFV